MEMNVYPPKNQIICTTIDLKYFGQRIIVSEHVGDF